MQNQTEPDLEDIITKDDLSEDSFVTASSASPERIRDTEPSRTRDAIIRRGDNASPTKLLENLNISAIPLPTGTPPCRLNTLMQNQSFAPDPSNTEVANNRDIATSTSTPVSTKSSQSCDDITSKSAKDNSTAEPIEAKSSAGTDSFNKFSAPSSKSTVLNTSSLDAWLSFGLPSVTSAKTVESKESSVASVPKVESTLPKMTVPPIAARKIVKTEPRQPVLATPSSPR